MALSMTEKEATGEDLNPSASLFDDRDFGRMQDTAKLRKEIRVSQVINRTIKVDLNK